jgi:DNA polymerase
MSTPEELHDEAIRLLKRLEKKGIRTVELGPAEGARGSAAVPSAAVMAGTTDETMEVGGQMENAVPDNTNSTSSLDEIRQEVSECTLCALHEGRNKTVFGVGNPATKVMFIGEAPGRDEDAKGEPFVGRAGQLLNKILAAIDLDRSDVYITNILKCRPPKNRDPQESEVRCCENYLKRQIALIQPNYICALGRISAQWLLQTNASLGAIRSGEYYYEGIRVIATYHPAALLRNPNFKKPCWEDMKKLRALLDEVQEG